MSAPPRGKDVAAAPRPRVALVGLEEEEVDELREFFPTVHVADAIADLPQVASPAELDLIVSASQHPATPHSLDNLNEYARCNLILFGPTAWLDERAPPSEPGHGHFYVCETRARSNQYVIASDMDPRLETALTEALPESVLGIPVIEFADIPQRKNDPRIDGWLAWAIDPIAPIAVAVFRNGYKTGLAWFTQRPTQCAGLVKAVCRIWAPKDRAAFPTIVEWNSTSQWATTEELAILAERTALIDEFETVRVGYVRRLAEIDQRLSGSIDRANAGPRAILTTQDAQLVAAVRLVFEELGFLVQDVDRDRGSSLPKREDLRLRKPDDLENWIALVEVKGHRKRGAADEDLTKIERHVKNFLKEEKREPSFKIYVCNSQFGLPPDVRQTPYAGSTAADHFSLDPDVPGLVVPTPDLFRLHRDRARLGLAAARTLLLVSRGVFKYIPAK